MPFLSSFPPTLNHKPLNFLSSCLFSYLIRLLYFFPSFQYIIHFIIPPQCHLSVLSVICFHVFISRIALLYHGCCLSLSSFTAYYISLSVCHLVILSFFLLIYMQFTCSFNYSHTPFLLVAHLFFINLSNFPYSLRLSFCSSIFTHLSCLSSCLFILPLISLLLFLPYPPPS